MMQRAALLILLAVSSTDASTSNLRNRELWGSSSSSSSGWSFWGSLLQLLDHMHTPCPPGSLHHKDSDGKPLPSGECWQDLKPKPHPKKKSHSGGGSHSSGGGGGGGGGHSGFSNFTFTECYEGDQGCYHNLICVNGDDDANCMEWIKCQDDDQDCQVWISCTDDSQNCLSNGWNGDGYDDSVQAVQDDATSSGWGADGWSSSSLGTNGAAYASKEVENSGGMPVWPFVAGALIAGVIGAMFVVSRRKRRDDQNDHPLDGAIKKRQRLFSGFSRKKEGALNEDFENEDGQPNFIEISEAKKKYKNPTDL